MAERKGLRFEVKGVRLPYADDYYYDWTWALVGKDDVVYARGPKAFPDEESCRSHIAKVRKVFKGAGFAKVITVDA